MCFPRETCNKQNSTAPFGWCLQLKVTTLQGHSRDVLSISFDPEDTVTVGHGWFEAVADSQRFLFQWEYNSMIITAYTDVYTQFFLLYHIRINTLCDSQCDTTIHRSGQRLIISSSSTGPYLVEHWRWWQAHRMEPEYFSTRRHSYWNSADFSDSKHQ